MRAIMNADFRGCLGFLKTSAAVIDDATADLHEEIARIGLPNLLLAQEERINRAAAEIRLHVARLEREIERIEIAEGERHV